MATLADDDFSTIFSSNSESDEYRQWDIDEYTRGWGYLGSAPPPMELFNSMQRHNDERINYLKITLDKTIQDLGLAYHYMGSVETYADLPTNATSNDVWKILEADLEHNIKAGDSVVWDTTQNPPCWTNLSGDDEIIDNEEIDTLFPYSDTVA